MDISGEGLQLGLNFAQQPPELFAGCEMGEDALRVFQSCLTLRDRICADVATELPRVRAACTWASAIRSAKSRPIR